MNLMFNGMPPDAAASAVQSASACSPTPLQPPVVVELTTRSPSPLQQEQEPEQEQEEHHHHHHQARRRSPSPRKRRTRSPSPPREPAERKRPHTKTDDYVTEPLGVHINVRHSTKREPWKERDYRELVRGYGAVKSLFVSNDGYWANVCYQTQEAHERCMADSEERRKEEGVEFTLLRRPPPRATTAGAREYRRERTTK